MANLRNKKEQEKIEIEEKNIYCGPSLPGISQFTIITGIPQVLKLHVEACTAVEHLIVPVEKLSHARLKLAVKGSYEQKKYIEIKNYLGGVR